MKSFGWFSLGVFIGFNIRVLLCAVLAITRKPLPNNPVPNDHRHE